MRTNVNRILPRMISILSFLFLAVALLLVTVFSVRFYRRTAEENSSEFRTATAAEYLRQKVRHGDENGAVRIGKFGDDDAIILLDTVNGTQYETVLYTWKGSLRELYAAADSALSPDAGTEIMEADGMKVSDEGKLISCSIRQDGRRTTVRIPVMSGVSEDEAQNDVSSDGSDSGIGSRTEDSEVTDDAG